jgi:hypothetical protein
MLPAGDLQADLPQSVHVPTFVLQTQWLLQCRSGELLCSQVRTSFHELCPELCPKLRPRGMRPGRRDVRRSRSLRRSGSLRGSLCDSVSCDVCRSRPLRSSGSSVCTGSSVCSDRSSVCSDSFSVFRCPDVRYSLRSADSSLCSGRRPLRSGPGQVLRRTDPVLQCGSLRSCTLDL